ncbi:MAG: hypothetical protein RR587_07290 [Solibacillus sp.]
MKKGMMMAFAAIAIIFGIMFSMINILNSSEPEYNPVIIRSTEEQVKEFLMQEKGYSENEIQKIESKRKAKTSDDSAIEPIRSTPLVTKNQNSLSLLYSISFALNSFPPLVLTFTSSI